MLKSTSKLLAVSLTVLAACQPVENTADSATKFQQIDLGSINSPLLEVDGFQFRDLNRSGTLDPYEDWRLDIETRTADLVSKMTLEEKAGAMMHSTLKGRSGPLAAIGRSEDGYDLDFAKTEIVDKAITSFITRLSFKAEKIAEENNAIQEVAEQGRLGIPVTISTDPRNHFQYVVGATDNATDFSQWPEPLGFAALGDVETMRNFGDAVRQEYRSIGIQQALSPQADLATEPQWPRATQTFGSNPSVARELVKAYVAGFQGGDNGLEQNGVLTVVKHWVGYGATPEGWDGHNYYGRFADLDNDSFKLHVEPFLGAFEVGVSGVMPTYSILRGVMVEGKELEGVGAGFSSILLNDLLRGTHKFDGIILSDWAITNDCGEDTCKYPKQFQGPQGLAMPWGVEDLTREERIVMGIKAGIDQYGGVNEANLVVQAVLNGDLTEARIDETARRVMKSKFQLGLFDNPFVDVGAVSGVVNNLDVRAEARLVQARSQVLLKNEGGLLPLKAGTKVYLDGLNSNAAEAAGLVIVQSADEADVSILRMSAPHDDTIHQNFFFGKMQNEGHLSYIDADADFKALMELKGKAPIIVAPFLDRPAILSNVQPVADAILANFGVSDEALMDVLTGKVKPEGKLPFELPSSDEAVKAQDPALPDDSDAPLYAYGAGLEL